MTHRFARHPSISSGVLFAALAFTILKGVAAQGPPQEAATASTHLTLPMAVDMALAHNRKLELARLSVRDSEQGKRIAESHFYPVIKNQSTALHVTELEGVVIPTGALSSGTLAGAVPASTVRIGQGALNTYTSGTGLEQPLTQMFKIRAGVRAADADLEIAKVQAADAEDMVALRVHQLYYSCLIEHLKSTAAEDAVKSADVVEEENEKGVKEGRLLAEAELSSRADLLDKQRFVLVSRLTLDELYLELDDTIGLRLGTRPDLDPDALGEFPGLPARNKAIEFVIEKSPAVLSARQNVEKAKAGLSSAQDAYIPDVTAIARYSYQSGVPLLKHNFGTFGGVVSYTLFDGGARQANLRAARLQLAMAQTQLAQAENDVTIQVSAAYDKVEQLQALLKVSELTLEVRQESYRIEVRRQQVSASLESAVENAHAAATAAKVNVLSAQLDLYLAEKDIKRQMGELPR
jgi:multidrug efflux system outer membrane protein